MYDLAKLAKGEAITMETAGAVGVQVAFGTLKSLVHKKAQDPEPDVKDLMLFASMVLEHKLNPYQGDCWLVYMRDRYVPIVSAQVRIAKCMAVDDYEGYEWGWISMDGSRKEQGGSIPFDQIAGAWAKVMRAGRSPFYHEMWYSEFGSKGVNMFLKALRDQTHRYAYADQMGNLSTDNEMMAFNPPKEETPRSKVILSQEIEDGIPTERRSGKPVQEPTQGGGESPGLQGPDDGERSDVRPGSMDQVPEGAGQEDVDEPETELAPEQDEYTGESIAPDPTDAPGTASPEPDATGPEPADTSVEAGGSGGTPVLDLRCSSCGSPFSKEENPPRPSGKYQCPSCLRIMVPKEA